MLSFRQFVLNELYGKGTIHKLKRAHQQAADRSYAAAGRTNNPKFRQHKQAMGAHHDTKASRAEWIAGRIKGKKDYAKNKKTIDGWEKRKKVTKKEARQGRKDLKADFKAGQRVAKSASKQLRKRAKRHLEKAEKT